MDVTPGCESFHKRVHFGMKETDRQEIASAITEDERGSAEAAPSKRVYDIAPGQDILRTESHR